ncbi:MAG: bifunctional 4-hydroxy-3-methylbut-2-enyl diphosphate reductase/30S ribosomal protein S1 [Ruminococcus sp.]|jgi:4-hydroxy-3-methylbut-2-enyl diphosphate reductase|nr:bifunctional 4-hydroxy-3-methylbut-2-enyl diphosphate reductase/30S ribosomal protein S1 [Ruminococcus sp.]
MKKPTAIKVAEHAGFCFGVERAVQLVENAIKTGRPVYTLGEIIHNKTVTDGFAARGVKIITPEQIDGLEKSAVVIIRSHGVAKSVYKELEQAGITYRDGTCPYVKKIHNIVSGYSDKGYEIIIFGDKEHDEVIGIAGNCEKSPNVIGSICEFSENFAFFKSFFKKKVAIVAQTTYNILEWENIKDKLLPVYFKDSEETLVFDTVCSATLDRQRSAEVLAKECAAVIIVGGANSANSKRLYDIARGFCETVVFIENVSEIGAGDISNIKNAIGDSGKISVGIAAGTSVPRTSIEEVKIFMSEVLNEGVHSPEEEDFAALLESSAPQKIYRGNRVHGIITGINNTEVTVDIGTKHTGYVDLEEFTEEADDPADAVHIGEEYWFVVTNSNDPEGIVNLSKRRADAKTGFDMIIRAKDEDTVLDGKVTEIIKGGLIVTCKGVHVFVPTSQSGTKQGEDLKTLERKNVKFKVIEVNEGRQRAIGSIKAANAAEREERKAKFWETAEVGQNLKGVVRSITNYGAFVDLGGMDGMIHLSELSWGRITHPSQVLSVGDEVDVYIKDVDKERGRVSLGYKDPAGDPYAVFADNYSVGQDVEVKIVSITPFGAFAEITEGVDGLIHISQLSDKRVSNVADVLKKGDVVTARITEIDIPKKRISLSMRALAEDMLPEEEEATEE